VRGFLTDPEVIFLDEPTLGLDVGAARDVRNFIRGWLAAKPGRSVLLTTHYMAEADELCDRIAIINGGRVLACDSPSNLKRRLRQEAIFHLEVSPLDGAADGFSALPGVRRVAHAPGDAKSEFEFILDSDDAISGVIAALTARRAQILNLRKREPTLEDVFVDLVGVSLADAEKS
jgi:ABC-2 type transport system ATP-binding protein